MAMTPRQVRAQRLANEWVVAEHGRMLIAEKTRSGEELIDFMCQVLRGARLRWPEVHPREIAGGTVPIRPSVQQRLLAAQWLAERLWGTPVRGEQAVLPGNESDAVDRSVNLSDAESARLREAYLTLNQEHTTPPTHSLEPGSLFDERGG
jgi:hypothetical protein